MNPLFLKDELLRIGQKELLDSEYVAETIVGLIDSGLVSGSVVVIDE
jgi:hypothetical protein